MFEGWGLRHGNYYFLSVLIDHEETWNMEVDGVKHSWIYG